MRTLHLNNSRNACMVVLALSLAFVSAPVLSKETERNVLTWPVPETLSPEGAAAMAAMGDGKLPDPLPPIADLRRMTDDLQTAAGSQLVQRYGVHVESAYIAGVPVRVIYPKERTALGKGPVLLNLHGGGFSLDSGSLTETIPIAALTRVPVVSVLYRLAPEHPFPAAVDDAFAVYKVLERRHGARHVAVFGTSAGAVLSAQLIVRLKQLHFPLPAAVGFLSGSADVSRRGDSEGWMPNPDRGYREGYIGKTALTDPAFSPQRGDLSNFPPTLLMTSTRDFLLSPTINFARALDVAGVETKLEVFDGLPHAFWSYMAIPETDQANTAVARFMSQKLGLGGRR